MDKPDRPALILETQVQRHQSALLHIARGRGGAAHVDVVGNARRACADANQFRISIDGGLVGSYRITPITRQSLCRLIAEIGHRRLNDKEALEWAVLLELVTAAADIDMVHVDATAAWARALGGFDGGPSWRDDALRAEI